jgi:hypothetical protein
VSEDRLEILLGAFCTSEDMVWLFIINASPIARAFGNAIN